MLPPWRKYQNSPESSIPIHLSFSSPPDVQRPEEIELVVALTFERFDAKLHALVGNASTVGLIPTPLLIDYQLERLCGASNESCRSIPFFHPKGSSSIGQERGSTINVASETGLKGCADWGAYGTSKSRIDGCKRSGQRNSGGWDCNEIQSVVSGQISRISDTIFLGKIYLGHTSLGCLSTRELDPGYRLRL